MFDVMYDVVFAKQHFFFTKLMPDHKMTHIWVYE